VLHPEYCLVLESPEGKIVGYTVGTPDSQAFDREQHQVWWPRVRAQYPLSEYPLDSVTPTRKDAELVNTAHTFAGVDEEISSRYPAHFHIDLLPEGQGGGRGRLMLESLLTVLKEAGATAVHLGVSSANEPAVGFYRHLGFLCAAHQPCGCSGLPRPPCSAATLCALHQPWGCSGLPRPPLLRCHPLRPAPTVRLFG